MASDCSWAERAPWEVVSPPEVNAPGARDPATYLRIADQFGLLRNPRYAANTSRFGLGPGTYCATYVWDVTRAMAAEIPHWLDALRRPARPFEPGAFETTANQLVDWLREGRGGWGILTDAREAYASADVGRPTVVTWQAPIGDLHGHMAVVMPGDVISQAGRANLWLVPIARGFGSLKDIEFWGHE